MGKILERIMFNRETKQKMLAVMINPDTCQGGVLSAMIASLKTTTPDFVFVGGSLTSTSNASVVELLKEETNLDIVLFPRHANQVAPHADAMLFMSLISGRNPEYLIGQQMQSAMKVKQMGMETIPTGYMLIDSGKKSTVEYISSTQPIPRSEKEVALATACAGELLGMKFICLDAGRDAEAPIPDSLIHYISQGIDIPLAVGGGIRSVKEMQDSFKAGADLVVIGSHFELHPEEIPTFVKATNYNRKKKIKTGK